MESAPMDFVSVIQVFTGSTAPIQLVLDPCATTTTTTFSTALIVATIVQKESKFHVNLMTRKTSSQVLPKAFAMASVRVSALHHTSERTAAFWIVSTIVVSMVTAASSFRNQDASVKMASRENTANIENANITARIRTESVLATLENARAMLSTLLTTEEYRGTRGRVMIVPTYQHGVDKNPSLYCNRWLLLLSQT
jgi:hypothetical protein